MLLTTLFLILGDLTPATQISQVAEQPQVQSIALYYSPKCPHSQKVLSYLRSENIKIPLKDVTRDSVAKEELRTTGGHLIVPCLIVDGKPIYQDDDIIAWLGSHRKTIPGNLQ